MKRIVLFVATNLAIMITLSIVLSILGIGGYRLPGGGLNYSALMVFCLVWGMGGAFISLQLSRFMAKMAMRVKLVDGRTGHEDLDWLHGAVRQLTERAGLPMPDSRRSFGDSRAPQQTITSRVARADCNSPSLWNSTPTHRFPSNRSRVAWEFVLKVRLALERAGIRYAASMLWRLPSLTLI